MKLRCAVLDDYQSVAMTMADWSPIEGAVDITVHHDHYDDQDDLVAAIGDCEIVVIMRERTPFKRPLFERLPKLRLLVTTGMRNSSVDVGAAADHGITVCGTPTTGQATAELTWGLILGAMRRMPRESAALRSNGRWQSTLGNDVGGKQLGVIGLGKLGARVAQIGKAFGMNVVAWSRNLTNERCAEVGVTHAGSLDLLLATSDIVTLHMVLSPRSLGLLGARELRLMKPTALLINTSRGPLVDESALIDALTERRIYGAGLDVFDIEPLPAAHPFRTLGNVLATPHLGYVTEENYRTLYSGAVEDIAAWLGGTPVRVLPKPD